MLKSIRVLIISSIISSFTFADVFMTELTDPQNSSDAGRYVELYNNGDSDIDLSSGWKIQRWTNGNADPTASSIKDLTGTISAGGFYIICNDADKYNATYGLTCDQDIGTGGAADGNGDDNIAILDVSGAIHDMFGVAGEDGTGTGHEFEDGRAERADGVTVANATWDETEWNIDNDSGGGDGNQYAPEGFDPGAWIGASTGGGDDCASGVYDCAGVCDGDAEELVCGCNDADSCNDCSGTPNGGLEFDDCGVCGGDDSSCSVSVTFSVDMSVEGVVGDIKVRTSTVNGEYNPSDWYVMSDNSDGSYSQTLSLLTGVNYGYNFNNSDGTGYESGDGLGDCAGGTYGNDRFITPGDANITLDTVCWESCEACPEEIPGCMDESALNYDENATVDDGSCISDWPDPANLFLSEYAEGSSNHKYLEVYNATDGDVDLSGYSLSSCSNGCDETGIWDYPDNVTFNAGSIVASGDVYVVCHGSADDAILAECDQTFTYLSNGDDVYALTQIGSGTILDIIGTMGDDPGSGWEVAGVNNGTKDHTLVRKASVSSGTGDWAASAGTTEDDSEWVVLDQNDWTYLGSHPHDFEDPCTYDGDVNGDGNSNVTDIVLIVGAIINADIDDSLYCSSDMNQDGFLNVTDIVYLVNSIINGTARVGNATDATITIAGNELSVEGNGFIQGIQLTLTHDYDFAIELADEYVAEYATEGNMTTVIIVTDGSTNLNDIATTSGDYVIASAIVVDGNGTVVETHQTTEITSFELSAAYPNPFNPITNLELALPEAGYVSVKIYNLVGQEVATLAEGMMEANTYSFTWDANSMSSGVYIVRAEGAGQVATQKLMLLK